MKPNRDNLIRRALKDERGQVIPWIAFMMILFLGMGAFVLDIGHAFFCYRELQSATDAAALAGATQLRQSNAVSVATEYSALQGDKNAYPSLNNVSMVPGYPELKCLTTVTNLGVPCLAPTNANTIIVKQQAIIPTFFAQVLGINQMTLSATAYAAVAGAKANPYNVVILLDTTRSMQDVDSNCNNEERITCAESGVQTLLQDLNPCSILNGCGTVTGQSAQYPLDQVTMMTFPNVSVGTAADDYNCSGTAPTIPVYSFPPIGGSSYAPSGSSTATYQITGFDSNYKASNGATTLNTSSDLAMTTGAGVQSGNPCPGMAAPGGDGTYYAGAIYAAQSVLTAQKASEVAANPNVTPINVLMILSDGEANADSSKMATTMTNGTAVNANNPWPSGGGATSTITNYPSSLDQCQQAVAAANYAKSQGTIVYSIAYGSESSGCTTDTTGPQVNITPCQVMSQMATPDTASTYYFYSDYNQSGSSSTCVASAPITDINDIFLAIAQDFLHARLIPAGTT
jgi:Flp pilus assembly protein TadG